MTATEDSDRESRVSDVSGLNTGADGKKQLGRRRLEVCKNLCLLFQNEWPFMLM